MSTDEICDHGGPSYTYEQQAEYQQKNRNEQSGFLAGTIFLCLATLLLSILHRRAQNSDGPVRLSPKPLASSRSPKSPDSSPPVELEAFTLNSEAAAHLRLAKYEVDWNNFESAIREYDAALALDPDNPGIVSARNRVIERSKQAR